MTVFDVEVLTRGPLVPVAPAFVVDVADHPAGRSAAATLRHAVFVDEQGLFSGSDQDWHDEDDRSLTLIARTPNGTVLGTVRLGPATPTRDLGWWTGSRLAVRTDARGHRLGVGSALVRAACAYAESRGALRFDATVQPQNVRLFERLGWQRWGSEVVRGLEHAAMGWPIDRIERQAARTKRFLADLLAPLGPAPHGLGGARHRGDDGVPVPGSDLVAAADAILPSMVERDPEWAGWCAVLVNVNDLAAMGATPVGLLDTLAARDASFAARIVSGLSRAAAAWQVPVLGGHTQLGVPAALAVTALGRTDHPVPGGGGRPGHTLTVTADLGGGWRRGYTGQQWDSTSTRSPAELAALQGFVARTRPAAAKDVSMAGLVGTVGMLAEASGCAAVLDVDRIPTPAAAAAGDWLSCFPGFAMITTDRPGSLPAPAGPAVSAPCGELQAGTGVRLRWPDGRQTVAVADAVTGLPRTHAPTPEEP